MTDFELDVAGLYAPLTLEKRARQTALMAAKLMDFQLWEFIVPTLAYERLQRLPRPLWETRGQAEDAIFEYINSFYKPRRRHSALG